MLTYYMVGGGERHRGAFRHQMCPQIKAQYTVNVYDPLDCTIFCQPVSIQPLPHIISRAKITSPEWNVK